MTAVAMECGFTDASHFARSFRRLHGVAPSAARVSSKQQEDGAANRHVRPDRHVQTAGRLQSVSKPM